MRNLKKFVLLAFFWDFERINTYKYCKASLDIRFVGNEPDRVGDVRVTGRPFVRWLGPVFRQKGRCEKQTKKKKNARRERDPRRTAKVTRITALHTRGELESVYAAKPRATGAEDQIGFRFRRPRRGIRGWRASVSRCCNMIGWSHEYTRVFLIKWTSYIINTHKKKSYIDKYDKTRRDNTTWNDGFGFRDASVRNFSERVHFFFFFGGIRWYQDE